MAADIAQRTELHAFASLTLSDRQFLLGDAAGQPVTLAGCLSLPPGAGPHPAVVLIHGSGGIGAAMPCWVRQLTALGIASFVVDGFTGRGLTSTATDQARLGRLAFILDLYRALGLLAGHPAIDPARVALMGFSRGGQAALYAAMTRFQRHWNHSGIVPAAHLAFYPDCATSYLEDTRLSAVPIRVFHGLADDYNTAGRARAYVARLRAAGADVVMTEYAGAHHGFDNPLSAGPAIAAGSQTLRRCTIAETEPGLLRNTATGRPFNYDDPCVERDPHVGGNPAAAAAARRDVAAFLSGLFRPV
ncbi:dienelactone hydrolase family protein [Roseomonas marmotae]|uniref:Dienelactone hydrolase family protein n=1 Tax=Roseomonas marmotae TaxID=2768161 RepID=A0ABS3KH56_9PROT|nr:dienelactone hydrolase family protein [Roseomonas marmotae]MBO1076794.1 dienelactone hydrolase family protein [Roseomonas marmotae]QTI78741.1 dienelactone hydrolase family protein [Roseomonas marmotae]